MRLGGGPGRVLGGKRRGAGRRSGLMTGCRNTGMASWRSAGGTSGCQSVCGSL